MHPLVKKGPGSQAACTGRHWKMSMRMAAIHHRIHRNPVAVAAKRKVRVMKMRRYKSRIDTLTSVTVIA